MSPGMRRLAQLVDEQAVLPLLNPAFSALPGWAQALGDRITSRPLQTLMFGTFPSMSAHCGCRFAVVPEHLRWIPEVRVALGR